MNSESKITVNHSALVSLKAELLRKHEEVKKAKAMFPNSGKIVKPNPAMKKNENSNKNKEFSKRKLNAEVVDIEDLNAHKKSKLMLEAKSRLYEQLSKSHTTINPNFLVDFKNKPAEEVDENPKVDSDEEGEINRDCDYDSDSEWVEYTDCFGRTRKCLREDLKEMQSKDEKLKTEVLEKKEEKLSKRSFFIEDRNPAKEPEIEIMRRKWEEQEEKLSHKADIHYQDVLFDEARTHGVGYFAFSQDDELRRKQQENLLKLREETLKKQKEAEKVREMKDKLEKNRLRVARIRQRVRAGLPIDDLEDDVEEEKEEEKKAEQCKNDNDGNTSMQTEEQPKEISNVEESSANSLQDTESKIDALGKLLGKRNRWYVMSQEEWVEKRRADRIDEFAPAYRNFEKGGVFQPSSSSHNPAQSKWDDPKEISEEANCASSDSDDDGIIGPMPPPSIMQTKETSSTVLNVEEGLKFLRQKFEN